jgi:Glycosyl transferase family 64 domain
VGEPSTVVVMMMMKVMMMKLLFKPARTAAAAPNKNRTSTVPAFAGLLMVWMVLVGLVAVNLLVFDLWRVGGNRGGGRGTVDPGVEWVFESAGPARRPADEKQSTIQKHISVVIMNHHRPTLLRDSSLLYTLAQHPAVGEILLLHSNPATAFNNTYLSSPPSASAVRTTMQQKKKNNAGAVIVDDENDNANDWWDKIQHVDAVAMNDQMGLAIRFYFCAQQARYEYVLIVDDDMECHAEAITILLQMMRDDPHRIVGRYGRTWSSKHRHRHDDSEYDGEYVLKNVYGHVEVVLTKFMMMEKIVCDAFVQQQHLMDDVALSVNDSRPIWNGEDIFVNLVANRLYHVPPHGPFTNLALHELPVWDIVVGSKLLVSASSSTSSDTTGSSVSVSGNPGGFLSTLLQPKSWRDYSARREKTRRHQNQRTKMWKLAKARLANVTVLVDTTGGAD